MQDLTNRLQQLKKKIDIPSLKSRIAEIEKQAIKPFFWQDHKKAGQLMQELSELQETVSKLESLGRNLEARSERLDEGNGKREELEKELRELEIKTFLSGKYDQSDAILALHAGQGGTEACDWTTMLLRMYQRFIDGRGLKLDKLDEVRGEEAGLKSVTCAVAGPFAYGYLRGEAGVHRLVRLSPFNANNLRQTSFALVEVLPVLEDLPEIEIKTEDLIFEAVRSSGPGGQNVNKVASAVRLTYKPSGISVRVDSQRHQHKNREVALQILRGKLYQELESKRVKETSKLKGAHKVPGWGNQIRSYILYPYQMVKDHRTGAETANAQAVLDGELDQFIEAEMRVIK